MLDGQEMADDRSELLNGFFTVFNDSCQQSVAWYLFDDALEPWQPAVFGQVRHVAHSERLKHNTLDVALRQISISGARVHAWNYWHPNNPART